MNMNIKTQFGGLFKFEVYKAETDELVQQTDWFHNLVLDQGLDGMATRNWLSGCAVGTDSTAPDVKQTALGKQVATINNSTYWYGTYNKDGIAYASQRHKFRFNAGTFNNTTLAEVAILMDNNKCWNRALITDENGKPTTITLLKDEYLDVTCEVRCYINMEDVAGSFKVVDKDGEVLKVIDTIMRPAILNGYYMHTYLANWFNNNFYGSALSGQKIGKAGDAPISNYNRFIPSTSKSFSYENGSYQYTKEITWGLNEANDINFFTLFTSTHYVPTWQIGFSEAIRKSNTQTLTFKITISWDRYHAA